MNYDTLINTINSIKKERGVSNYKLSKLTEIGENTLSNIFSGKHQTNFDTIIKILHALGLTLTIEIEQ